MLKGITESDAAALAESVKASKGRLILLVHPYFRNVNDKDYLRTVDGIIGRRKNLVIMEEEGRTQSLKERLKRLQRPCLVIPTGRSRSSPLLEGNKVDQGHGDLYRFIKSVGAKSVFLGGMNLWERSVDAGNRKVEQYERRWLQARDRKKNQAAVRTPSKTVSTNQCVGNTYCGLVTHAIRDEQKGNEPLKVLLMPGAAYGPLPYYSFERKQLHKRQPVSR